MSLERRLVDQEIPNVLLSQVMLPGLPLTTRLALSSLPILNNVTSQLLQLLLKYRNNISLLFVMTDPTQRLESGETYVFQSLLKIFESTVSIYKNNKRDGSQNLLSVYDTLPSIWTTEDNLPELMSNHHPFWISATRKANLALLILTAFKSIKSSTLDDIAPGILDLLCPNLYLNNSKLSNEQISIFISFKIQHYCYLLEKYLNEIDQPLNTLLDQNVVDSILDDVFSPGFSYELLLKVPLKPHNDINATISDSTDLNESHLVDDSTRKLNDSQKLLILKYNKIKNELSRYTTLQSIRNEYNYKEFLMDLLKFSYNELPTVLFGTDVNLIVPTNASTSTPFIETKNQLLLSTVYSNFQNFDRNIFYATGLNFTIRLDNNNSSSVINISGSNVDSMQPENASPNTSANSSTPPDEINPHLLYIPFNDKYSNMSPILIGSETTRFHTSEAIGVDAIDSIDTAISNNNNINSTTNSHDDHHSNKHHKSSTSVLTNNNHDLLQGQDENVASLSTTAERIINDVSLANNLSIATSPKQHNMRKLPTRRAWSKFEESVLREGLKEYGTSWSKILDSYGPHGKINQVLKNRTQIQLKDKARNWKISLLKHQEPLPFYLEKVTGNLENVLSYRKKGTPVVTKIEKDQSLNMDNMSVSSTHSNTAANTPSLSTVVAAAAVTAATSDMPNKIPLVPNSPSISNKDDNVLFPTHYSNSGNKSHHISAVGDDSAGNPNSNSELQSSHSFESEASSSPDSPSSPLDNNSGSNTDHINGTDSKNNHTSQQSNDNLFNNAETHESNKYDPHLM
ncbi:hypothetical protein TBLA_0J00460 [Henningerozyma blattae CBS 6284]|uniref:HTH myb-type domain-containing protein n=1 Tax=Henningerozyma blattae (strain ATCC 34711 / CBS 6284 / DSM 70876 / NBRC 10599 / NRRL Y-10934 / UCD 77-7) TaxID=1071380 RepID=I2H9J4_HENB6|nr:hypothetical protein TBLA_0J00460 [Tetrapisispora blattae CBS 6284]CCH63046.1 hypothetical protein TBLA_0J00460 [Tetrapisispora blattae CBS 6284]